MKQIDTQTLMAYVDGELDVEERCWVEQSAAENPELQQQIQQLSRLDMLVGTAFNDAIYQAQPPLRAMPPTNRKSARYDPRPWLARLFSWQSGVAVALLVGGIGIGGWYERQFQQVEVAISQQQLQQAIEQALENHRSNDPFQWVGGQSQGQLSITPIRTYKNAQGQYCREFIERQEHTGYAVERRGVACRDEKGWQLKANFYL